MRQFILNDGSVALVDEEDFWYLSQWIWSPKQSNGGIYAIRRETRSGCQVIIWMHNEVAERMGLDTSTIIDHKDRDTLDNTRKNLREATHTQNLVNSKMRSDNTSGYKGIWFHRQNQKWCAELIFEKKKIRLGSHATKEDAARAYDRAAVRYFGEFAVLNFPEEHNVT